jgi:hypothetical protein
VLGQECGDVEFLIQDDGGLPNTAADVARHEGMCCLRFNLWTQTGLDAHGISGEARPDIV